MKFLIAVLLVFSASSFAKTPAEIKDAYDGCISFLNMPRSQQVKVAAKSGYSLDRCLWGCNLMKKNGLEKSIELEEEYQRESSAPSTSSGGTVHGVDPGPSSSSSEECSSSIMCPGVGMYQCINHHCQEISPPFHQCDDAFSNCALGEKCVNGVCH